MFLSVFLMLFFGFFILFGSLGLRNVRRLQRTGVRTTATVVGMEKREGHDSQGKTVSYHLKLEFKTANGETVTVESSGGINKKKSQRMADERAQFPIIYDPAKPSEYIKDKGNNEVFPMIMMAIGMIGLAIGFLGLVGVIDMPDGNEDYWGP